MAGPEKRGGIASVLELPEGVKFQRARSLGYWGKLAGKATDVDAIFDRVRRDSALFCSRCGGVTRRDHRSRLHSAREFAPVTSLVRGALKDAGVADEIDRLTAKLLDA